MSKLKLHLSREVIINQILQRTQEFQAIDGMRPALINWFANGNRDEIYNSISMNNNIQLYYEAILENLKREALNIQNIITEINNKSNIPHHTTPHHTTPHHTTYQHWLPLVVAMVYWNYFCMNYMVLKK